MVVVICSYFCFLLSQFLCWWNGWHILNAELPTVALALEIQEGMVWDM